VKDGTSVWWQVQSRNKQSVAIDLRTDEGREIVRLLVAKADVLIENFRPGTMEAWGLGWSELSSINPALIMLRVSGFGQDGPYRDRPGFGAVAEAVGGLRHLTGEPGRIPVRTGVAIGDTLAALHGAIGVLLALYDIKANGGAGQVIDVALYESVFNCMDSLLPEFSVFGAVREAAGSALPGVAPTNAYRCSDGLLVLAANGDSIFKRLMLTIGRNDLASDPELASNEGRVRRASELDCAISSWARELPLANALDLLGTAGVPASKIYTAKDIAEDPHYHARDMIQRIRTRSGYDIDIPGVVPKLSATPGSHRFAAPHLGENTRAVLESVGIGDERLRTLAAREIVGLFSPESDSTSP
jgi:formyl-CoA transferase